MRLYTRTGATKVQASDGREFDAAEDGSFDLPDDVGEFLHRLHVGGKQAWENDAERHARLLAEEDARRRDPKSLYDLIASLQAQAQLLGGGDSAPLPATLPKSPRRKADTPTA